MTGEGAAGEVAIQDGAFGMNELLARLNDATQQSTLQPMQFIGLSSTYNNVARLCGYVDGNERFLDPAVTAIARDQLFLNPALNARFADLFSKADGDGTETALRSQWADWFRLMSLPATHKSMWQIGVASAMAQGVLADLGQSQAQLLERLGVTPPIYSSYATYFSIVSRTRQPEVRSRLARAWGRQRDVFMERAVAPLDEMLLLQRAFAKAKGFSTPLAETLSRGSGPSEGDVKALVYLYLRRAIDAHTDLEAIIRAETGCAESPMDHFPYFLRARQGARTLPMLSLDACLAYVADITSCYFGAELRATQAADAEIQPMAVYVDGVCRGHISFDLLDRAGPRPAFIGSGNSPTEWEMSRPSARVLCRHSNRQGVGRAITFESLHSVLHEFGHALNHVLARHEVPTRSGGDCLPVERLENLSCWFEKWAFHPGLAARLGLSDEDKEGLAVCRSVKMLEFRRTNLDRALTAALDFELHRRQEGGYREVYAEIDASYGVSRFCGLAEILHHFTTMNFTENCGGSFAYLWGGAFGAENFKRLAVPNLQALEGFVRATEVFAPCFDRNIGSALPDIGAVFEFYSSDGCAFSSPPA